MYMYYAKLKNASRTLNLILVRMFFIHKLLDDTHTCAQNGKLRVNYDAPNAMCII